MELLAKAVRRKKRPNFKPEFKKQLAQRSLEPGVSVSLLAQENDINVNMLFKWRRQLREGLLDDVAYQHTMLPVAVIEEKSADVEAAARRSTEMPETAAAHESTTGGPGMIEIQTAGAVIRFDGAANLNTIRAVLGMLRP